MKKNRYSLCLDPQIIELIDDVAERNQMSRSGIVRLFLGLVKEVSPDKLQFIPSIPALLDKKNGEVDSDS